MNISILVPMLTPMTFQAKICLISSKMKAAEHRFDPPLASLIVQGKKKTVIGHEEYALAANKALVVCLDISKPP